MTKFMMPNVMFNRDVINVNLALEFIFKILTQFQVHWPFLTTLYEVICCKLHFLSDSRVPWYCKHNQQDTSGQLSGQFFYHRNYCINNNIIPIMIIMNSRINMRFLYGWFVQWANFLRDFFQFHLTWWRNLTTEKYKIKLL